ncbi:hypothetical protein [Aeromonas sp. 6P]|uniref:hypothetical protein n=1 Tax=Aeromonas sp. 6P TaxID=3452722 RepID=UPI003A1AB2E8
MIGYAIRNDLSAWRAVQSRDDVAADEYYSETPVAIKTNQTIDLVESQRLIAYSDPITGSDRYFSEASRLTAMTAPAEDIAAAIAAGITRASEIAAMYPWPANNQSE